MNYPTPISFLPESKSNYQETKIQNNYIIKLNDINYKLIISKDIEFLTFRIELTNISYKHYYDKKYDLQEIISIFKLDLKINCKFDQIIEFINDAYLNNKISIDISSKNKIKLIIKLKNNKNKDYESILVLDKREYKINEKFDIIINEIDSIKKSNQEMIENKLKEIKTELNDLKKNINEKLKENKIFIDSLTTKIKNNDIIIKDNNKIIQSLKIEIDKLNHKLDNFKEKIQSLNSINKEEMNKEKEEYDKYKNLGKKFHIVAFSTYKENQTISYDIIKIFLENNKYIILKNRNNHLYFKLYLKKFKEIVNLNIDFISNLNKEYNQIVDVNCYFIFIDLENEFTEKNYS